MSRNVIRDGQTRRGHVDAVPRMHDQLTFEYRPMLAEEVESVESEATRVPSKDGVLLIAKATTGHLVSWSEEDQKDKPLPITLDNVRRLPFPLLNRLYRVVAGLVATDEVPNSQPDDLNERLEALRREVNGVSLIEAQGEEAKN